MTRILIIEDDRQFAETLKDALEADTDIKIVDILSDEATSISSIRSGIASTIDCFIVDLQLPEYAGDLKVNPKAGLNIIEVLRQELRYFGTIVVLTSSRSVEDGQRALSAGCDAYLCKYAPIEEIPTMLAELKLAVKGSAIVVSRQMRHVFMRDDISAKEARLLDLLLMGKGWSEISKELNYKTAKAAANIGDRLFDKLLTEEDRQNLEITGGKKRVRAIALWKARKAGVTNPAAF